MAEELCYICDSELLFEDEIDSGLCGSCLEDEEGDANLDFDEIDLGGEQ